MQRAFEKLQYGQNKMQKIVSKNFQTEMNCIAIKMKYQ